MGVQFRKSVNSRSKLAGARTAAPALSTEPSNCTIPSVELAVLPKTERIAIL